MKTRDTIILELRGETIGTISNQSSTEETFQNQTLRPILKFQNALLIQVFTNYAISQKSVFFSLSPEKKQAYIESTIHRDIKFRNALKGIVIGMFTIQEFKDYSKNTSNLNKRMMTMLIERLKSQVILFETAS